MSPELVTGLILVVAAAVIGSFVWSAQRVIGRIDRIGDQLADLGSRVSVIETKQEATGNNVRKTAKQVGVPVRDIENTIDPRKVARA